MMRPKAVVTDMGELISMRSPTTEAARALALRNLRQKEIDALIVIGGDGSQQGSYLLSQTGFPIVGIASTIDKPLWI